jgi:ribosomal protein S18 acetylase RimI-like enzyme
MQIVIRPASSEDGPSIREIEWSAGERFRDVGLPEIAEDEPPSAEILARYAEDGRSWVAVDQADNPIGYVIVDVVDGNAHVEQVSVHPDRQGTRVGRALLEHVRAWAAAADLPAVTLTTFIDVPWNAPLYRHLGFRVLGENDIGLELWAIRDAEASHGLDPARRVCMRWEVLR